MNFEIDVWYIFQTLAVEYFPVDEMTFKPHRMA